MSILLKNAVFIDWETLKFSSTDILVQDGENEGLVFTDDSQDIKVDKILDCSGKFVTKSFAIGHHHIYSALSRGMPAPTQSPENFYEILKLFSIKFIKIFLKRVGE